LENLTDWKKPQLHGVAKKMDRIHIKSAYCLKAATQAFEDLIRNLINNFQFLKFNFA